MASREIIGSSNGSNGNGDHNREGLNGNGHSKWGIRGIKGFFPLWRRNGHAPVVVLSLVPEAPEFHPVASPEEIKQLVLVEDYRETPVEYPQDQNGKRRYLGQIWGFVKGEHIGLTKEVITTPNGEVTLIDGTFGDNPYRPLEETDARELWNRYYQSLKERNIREEEELAQHLSHQRHEFEQRREDAMQQEQAAKKEEYVPIAAAVDKILSA